MCSHKTFINIQTKAKHICETKQEIYKQTSFKKLPEEIKQLITATSKCL